VMYTGINLLGIDGAYICIRFDVVFGAAGDERRVARF
jgi:hypothetical protein